MGNEIWRPVVGFEGWYEVSHFGSIRRVKAAKGTQVGRILKPALWGSDSPYHCVWLSRENRRYPTYVHHAVAEAFLGQRPKGHQVNHKDSNTLNNHIDNLEWVTPSENIRHGVARGNYDKLCQCCWCGSKFYAWHSARYCSHECRKAKYRPRWRRAYYRTGKARREVRRQSQVIPG